ncbi:signal peptide peptidase SppA [Pseudomarimonas arenosa]|uniref:Signal peptide peptidase SppA n=1 Tax=Pseudomarimonas arenosa TaxID=2774145 RepID=A0AAW3ZNM9_9GAMM|nr:signal peptide peptidase SppA [Pseudomarimonas arenosa]MBD8527745.1 signal peptide peptidase SppA [Pseudomarimonas arenosa]
MADKNTFFLWRWMRGLWDALNFTRRLIFNLVFLFILVLLIAAMFGDTPVLEENTTLVLAPQGFLVEQFSTDPMQRALGKLTGDGKLEVQVRDLRRAIDAAAKDQRINRLLIRPEGLLGGGFASLREVAEALQRFRAAGKQVVVFADFMEQRQYYLAAQADEIYLNPEGAVLLEGLARYRTYFREAIEDKLGANVHLFRVGEFKSYGEPYTRDSPSPEALQADLYWMGDVWQRYLSEVAESRKLDSADLQAGIDQLDQRLAAVNGDFAALALEARLVDKLLHENEVEALLIERGTADEGDLRAVGMEQYLNFLKLEQFPFDTRPQIAVVVAEGEILDGEQPPGTIGGRSTSDLIARARENDEVKAIVLRVNSPGGSAFASEQIRHQLALAREAGKPVVVSMGDVAASGGYWVSMASDQVIADPSTITGSIGVVGLFFTVPDTLAKLGLHVDGAGTTELAGALDPRRPLKPMVGNIIQSSIENTYRDFIQKAANARELEFDAVDEVARGRVWTGAQALERGLIDRLGNFQDAIDHAAELAKLEQDKYQLSYIEGELTPFQQFLSEMGQQSRAAAWLQGSGMLSLLADQGSAADLKPMLRWLQQEQGKGPVRAVAHCFCGL